MKAAPGLALVNVVHAVTRRENGRQQAVAACDLLALEHRVEMAVDGDVEEVSSGCQAQKRRKRQVHVLNVTKSKQGDRVQAYRNLIRRIFKATLFE